MKEGRAICFVRFSSCILAHSTVPEEKSGRANRIVFWKGAGLSQTYVARFQFLTHCIRQEHLVLRQYKDSACVIAMVNNDELASIR